MLFSGDIALDLSPTQARVPFHTLLTSWARQGFAQAQSRAALEGLLREHDCPAGLFEPSQIDHGGMAATTHLLVGQFSPSRPWQFTFRSGRGRRQFEFELAPDQVAVAAALIRAAGRSPDPASFRDSCAHLAEDDLLEELCRAHTTAPRHGRWPAVTTPGIYRREHASLVVRSRTTTLLVDPQGCSAGWWTQGSRYPGEQGLGAVDAVLVTHSHDDHWHLPSVVYFAADPEVPVIVPCVPRPNLLTDENLSASLRLAGQRTIEAPWHSTHRVGDIEIDVLPFFGEQPLRREEAGHPDLWNWGSCYRFRCPDFSALILVDSGGDARGDMIDVLRRSTDEHGPVDVLLSNCLEFDEVINFGLPKYVLAVPFEAVEAAYERLVRKAGHSVTLGVAGVVDACRATQARLFLPYAHGYQGIGNDPRGEEGDGSPESLTTKRVTAAVQEAGLPTEVLSWSPGDVLSSSRGTLELVRYPSR